MGPVSEFAAVGIAVLTLIGLAVDTAGKIRDFTESL